MLTSIASAFRKMSRAGEPIKYHLFFHILGDHELFSLKRLVAAGFRYTPTPAG